MSSSAVIASFCFVAVAGLTIGTEVAINSDRWWIAFPAGMLGLTAFWVGVIGAAISLAKLP